jgi:uncharacterized protein with FMN-binding domain
MRRALAAALSVATTVVPAADAAAGTKKSKPRKTVTSTTKTVTGPVEQADRWGDLQVTVLIKKTTTKLGRKILSVHQKVTKISVPIYPNHTGRSLYINQTALPWLIQEALQAQSPNVQLVSGATYSSEAFASSLQGALTQAAFKE